MQPHFPRRGSTPLPDSVKGNAQAIELLLRARNGLQPRGYICSAISRAADPCGALPYEDDPVVRLGQELCGLIEARLRLRQPADRSVETLGIWLSVHDYIEMASVDHPPGYQYECRLAWLDDLIEELS